MTSLGLLALTLLSAPTTGAARSTELPATVHVEEAMFGQSAPLRPAEVVAARVRAVLQDHANGQAWQELAGALPEMAVTGGADIESTFEAARLAEDMVARVPSLRAPPTVWEEVVRRLKVIDVDMVTQALAVALGLFALWMVIAGKNQRPRLADASVSSVRYREARSLAAEGIPLYEIARRTGLARDAVSVLLSRRAR